MVTVAARMLAPVPDACITEALDRLKKPNHKKSSGRVAEPGGPVSCAQVFRTCGNCHLPKVNNCNYRFTFKHEGQSVETVAHVWRDFKRFTPRGRTAERMFDLVARHQVGCTTCHVGHGDFQLNQEGLHFKKIGEVIRKVPLAEFLRK